MKLTDNFLKAGLKKAMIDDYFSEELERAGYDGMNIKETPQGKTIVLRCEKPGMVIGKGGNNIRELTSVLESRFDLDDVSIDVQEVNEPDLSAPIVASKLANALERGWYFREAGMTTVERVMEAGAKGVEIVFSGKLTGARARDAKFSRGYIKYSGEPANTIVENGQSEATMPLGTIGITVRLIPPGKDLPDDIKVKENVDVDEIVANTDDINEVLLKNSTDEEDEEEAEDTDSDDENDEETSNEEYQEEVID